MNELCELTERQVDGEATREEQARLRALLQDKAARAMYVRHVTLMATVRGICKATDQEASEVRSRQGPAPVRRTIRWYPRLLALAASLAIVAGGVWWFSQRTDASLELRVAEVGGKCSVFSVQYSEGKGAGVQGAGGKNIQHPTANSQRPSGEAGSPLATRNSPLKIGDILRPGDGIEVGADGYAKLVYPDTTQVELQQNSRLRVTLGAGRDKDAKRLALDGGRLVCLVAPQRKPFLLETAHAVAEVVGTRFSLAENGAQTTLAVQEGRVDLHQKDQRLEVSAGETSVADAAGLRKLSPADAWITELLARAEAAPWDVLNLGAGVYSNDVWRMDARGGPTERRIWNMISGGNDLHQRVMFHDGKRWARGVVVGRMMILPDSQAASEVVGAVSATNVAWQTYNDRVQGTPAAHQKSQRASVSFNCGPPEKTEVFSFAILHKAECSAGVWYSFAAYVDTETQDGLRGVGAAWPAENVATPQAAVWLSGVYGAYANRKFEIGLSAAGVRMVTQGLKFVPLGADMPLPPQELLDRK